MRFHHLGIACNNISNTINYLRKIYEITDISDKIYDINQKADVCLLSTSNNISIELISGTQTDRFLKKNIYLYHMCYQVFDINKTLKKFIQSGSILISPPKKAILFNHKKVAFIYTKIGIIELLEK
jgi:methylmalonyl-CoA/ethylmalonyl-CoA epimerase